MYILKWSSAHVYARGRKQWCKLHYCLWRVSIKPRLPFSNPWCILFPKAFYVYHMILRICSLVTVIYRHWSCKRVMKTRQTAHAQSALVLRCPHMTWWLFVCVMRLKRRSNNIALHIHVVIKQIYSYILPLIFLIYSRHFCKFYSPQLFGLSSNGQYLVPARKTPS